MKRSIQCSMASRLVTQMPVDMEGMVEASRVAPGETGGGDAADLSPGLGGGDEGHQGGGEDEG